MADSSHAVLIDDAEEASKVPAKRRAVHIKPTVERLTSALYEDGALPDELIRLINLITHPGCLDQASLAAIVRNLYPANKVPGEAILHVIGCLGHGELKPSLTIQSHLLRWLVMVYHVLEQPETLSRAYAVLFNLLDTAAVRPQICHLLALMTRRKHVRPYRLQAILELSRQTGSEPALTGLLRVFKNYYPEIIVGDVTRGRAAAFKHPDPAWRSRLDEIQQDHRSRSQLDATVRTLHAQEDSITLEEIDNADSVVNNLEKIELPSQLVAVLADPLLQKLMLLRPDHEASIRVNNWVRGCIRDVRAGDGGCEVLLDLVEVLQDYVSATKSLPQVFLKIFHDLFKVWHGSGRREAVLDVLAYMPIGPFKSLHEDILAPLGSCILDNTPETQLVLLRFYTSLLRNWIIILSASEDINPGSVSSLSGLIDLVHSLALTLLQTSPRIPTQLAILKFCETTASLVALPDIFKELRLTIIPHPSLVYMLHFSSSLATVSRLCDVVATYKRGLETVMNHAQDKQLTPMESERVKTFNGFLMDICNCIWRLRAFTTSDLNAQGCHVDATVVKALEEYATMVDPDTPLATMFGLSYSPVVSLQSLEYIRDLEDGELEEGDSDIRERHGGPVTQKSLGALRNRGGLNLTWQEYRLGVLSHLEEKGFVGIPKLMYNTMKLLMSRKR